MLAQCLNFRSVAKIFDTSMAEPARPRSSCCACMCFRRAPNKSKPEDDEDTSSIVFYRKFSDVWEEDSAEEEIITCSQPLDDRVEHGMMRGGGRHLPHHLQHLAGGDACHEQRRLDYRKYLENMRGVGGGGGSVPVRVTVDSGSDVTSWVETPESGEQTELIGYVSRQNQQRMRDNRRLLTLPLKEDRYVTDGDDITSPESDYCDELSRHRGADLSFSIDDSISNFMQSRVTMWTAGSGLLNESDGNMLQEEVWSIHSDSAILLRDYMFPNEDWQASLDSFGSDLDLSQEDEEEEGEDENGNADESTKILKSSSTTSSSNSTKEKSSRTSTGTGSHNANRQHRQETNGNRKYYSKSPMSLPGDTYRPVRSTNTYDYDLVTTSTQSDMARVHRNINDTRNCSAQHHEKRWGLQQGVKRKEAASTPDDAIDEVPRQSEIAA